MSFRDWYLMYGSASLCSVHLLLSSECLTIPTHLPHIKIKRKKKTTNAWVKFCLIYLQYMFFFKLASSDPSVFIPVVYFSLAAVRMQSQKCLTSCITNQHHIYMSLFLGITYLLHFFLYHYLALSQSKSIGHAWYNRLWP